MISIYTNMNAETISCDALVAKVKTNKKEKSMTFGGVEPRVRLESPKPDLFGEAL